jgi:hypothetical protein
MRNHSNFVIGIPLLSAVGPSRRISRSCESIRYRTIAEFRSAVAVIASNALDLACVKTQKFGRSRE